MNTRNLDQLYAAGLRLHEAGQVIAGTFATRGLDAEARAIRGDIETLTDWIDQRLARIVWDRDTADQLLTSLAHNY